MGNLVQYYNKLSNWGKVLVFSVLFISVVSVLNHLTSNKRPNFIEGFEQQESFLSKSDVIAIYDDFYANIYDYLVFNEVKNDYEIGEIVSKTHITQDSRVLDVGSGTGRHVGELLEKHISVEGIDISPHMVAKAKENYPALHFLLTSNI